MAEILLPVNNAIQHFVPVVSKRVQGKIKKNTVGKKYPRHIQRAMKKKHDSYNTIQYNEGI